MKVLIDNGHGIDTLGKCSPDHRLKEWAWTRSIAQMLSRALTLRGVDTMLLTPETNDVPINERVRKANAWCNRLGAKNVVLVSIHANAAASDSQWHNASGCSVYVSNNASQNSKQLAKIFTEESIALGLSGNRSIPASKYWQGNFGIIRDTKCPAVLTENMFMDNKQDVEFMLSDKGKQAIVEMHLNAICKYIASR